MRRKVLPTLMVPQGQCVEKESVLFYTGGLFGSGIRARILWPAANPQTANCLHFAWGPGGLVCPDIGSDPQQKNSFNQRETGLHSFLLSAPKRDCFSPKPNFYYLPGGLADFGRQTDLPGSFI